MKTIPFLTILVLFCGIISGCQKEATVTPNSEAETGIKAPQLKTGELWHDYLWYLWSFHLEIQTLVDEGTLSKGNGNALIVKLDAAYVKVMDGNYKAACGILGAFINLVEDFVYGGKILPDLGEKLKVGPNAIIESLTHQCGDSIRDWRDGQSYNTVQIDGRCWFSDNLNYETDNSWHFNNNPENGEIYGRLYTNDAAIDACPIGWHLPTKVEWQELWQYLVDNGYGYGGSGEDIAKSMASTSYWNSSSHAGDVGNDQLTNNSSGFNARPGGYYRRISGQNPGEFRFLGQYGYFLSAPDRVSYYYVQLVYHGDWVGPGGPPGEERQWNGYSVRCVHN